jgi:hypothetical protein
MDDGMVTCPNCGNEVRTGVRFCSHCGRLMTEAQSSGPPIAGGNDDFAARLSGGSGVVLSKSGRAGSGGTQQTGLGADTGDAPGDGWNSNLSQGGDDELVLDDSQTRGIPIAQSPAASGQSMPSSGTGGALPSPRPQFDPPPPPRYDDRPQYSQPPPPRYGQEFESSAYSPPRYDQLPVPVSYNQPMAGFQCPYCRTTIPPVTLERVSQTGWIVLALMIIFCLPLFWVGLLIKEPYRVCSQCRNVLS